MIKLFRRIRKQLFSENKFTRYSIYAIGEIFLVVIGILIALQVNNYNEQRKTNIKEKKYLVSMKNELLNNIEVVKTEMERLNTSLNAQRQLMSLIDAEIESINENELSKTLGLSIANGISLKYQDGTFKELLYSGGLIAISNDSIKNIVTSWEGRMSIVLGQEEGVSEARSKIVNHIIAFGDLRTIFDNIGALESFGMEQSIKKNGNKKNLKSQQFENSVSFYIVLGGTLKLEYERLEKDIHNLLRMVKEELDK